MSWRVPGARDHHRTAPARAAGRGTLPVAAPRASPRRRDRPRPLLAYSSPRPSGAQPAVRRSPRPDRTSVTNLLTISTARSGCVDRRTAQHDDHAVALDGAEHVGSGDRGSMPDRLQGLRRLHLRRRPDDNDHIPRSSANRGSTHGTARSRRSRHVARHPQPRPRAARPRPLEVRPPGRRFRPPRRRPLGCTGSIAACRMGRSPFGINSSICFSTTSIVVRTSSTV